MLQAPINARLSLFAGSPLWASFFSFLTGTIFLVVLAVVTRQPLAIEGIRQTSPWMWTGGLLGAFFVTTTIFAVPQLGPGLMIALIVTGQMLAALVIDHTGFMLPEAHPMNWGRVIGAVFMIFGVVLIKKF